MTVECRSVWINWVPSSVTWHYPSHTSCLRVIIAVKRHHDYGNSYKRKRLIGWLAYSFRGEVHYHHAGKYGGRHDAGVAESPIPCRQQEVDWDTGWYPEHRKPQSPPPQWRTSSNKAIPTPIKSHLLIVPLPMRLWGPITVKLPYFFIHPQLFSPVL